MRKRGISDRVLAVQRWFRDAVTYEGEPYVIDYEQAAAVTDESLNTIVVARAGSGKTRTLVAKIVHLVARCGVKPEEIMAFVFNANAAREINERLSRMRVDGETIISDVRIASTFHAFSRKIVYEVCRGEKKCGKILAGQKDGFVRAVVMNMVKEKAWNEKVLRFARGVLLNDERGLRLSDVEIDGVSQMMLQFINRAGQKYLGGEMTVGRAAEEYLEKNEVGERERFFIEIGVEVFRRYHWYLLDSERGLSGFSEYGTDFNLIVSWASKLIQSGRSEVIRLLKGKKYILIDEYQDFSQLFLAAVQAVRSVARDVRLFVVGDDWQAINRFAGSDVEFFRNFEGYFREGFRRYEITTNYRCDKMVVDTARKFMLRAMREKGASKAFSRRIGKVVILNPRETEVGYALVPYDLRVSAEDRILKEAVARMKTVVVNKKMVQCLKTVIRVIKVNAKAKDIMILHRNNETNMSGVSLDGFLEGLKWGLDRLGIMNADEFDSRIRLMTMHKSKGLEADVVIILEADEGVIPKLHPDTVLYRMFGETEEVSLDDQKRLFYVAMTRAKHRLYIMSEGGGFVKYLGRGVERWGE